MTLYDFISLQIKYFYRNIFISKGKEKLLFYLICLFALCYLTVMPGYHWNYSLTTLPPLLQKSIYLFTLFILLFGDFIIKYLYKPTFIFPLGILWCLPNSEKLITNYSILKESLSPWNFYLLGFFSYFIIDNIYFYHDTTTAILVCIHIYMFSLTISNIINYFKLRNDKWEYKVALLILLFFSFFAYSFLFIIPNHWENSILFFGVGLNIYLIKQNSKKLKYTFSATNSVRKLTQKRLLSVNYPFINLIELHLLMIIRSPRLKYQAIITGVFTLTSIYLVLTKTILTEKFEIQIILVSMIFSFSALTLNQYLFSAEGSFFDRLTLLPTFHSFLKFRYIEYLLFTIFLF